MMIKYEFPEDVIVVKHSRFWIDCRDLSASEIYDRAILWSIEKPLQNVQKTECSEYPHKLEGFIINTKRAYEREKHPLAKKFLKDWYDELVSYRGKNRKGWHPEK
jgi:hypothetical protein